MFNPSKKERIINTIQKRVDKGLAKYHQHLLNNLDFSIISNNCWGGICYEYYNLPKLSPTIGAYFWASDYIQFCKRLRYYTSLDIRMITVEQSIHKDFYIKNGAADCPVGVLDDVELIFLHYKDPRVAADKWNRRASRINFDNLIFKFSKMNGCTEKELTEFDSDEIPGKKFMFVNNPSSKYKHAIYYPGFEKDDQIENDTFYWNRYFDVTKFINE